MSRIARRFGAGLVLAGMALAAAGCGDEALWARWCSDRDFFHAQAFERHVEAKGRQARDDEWQDAEEKYRTVVERYPASRWASPAPPPGPGRDVAATSARAAHAIAQIEVRRGRDAEAAALWERFEQEYASLPLMVVAARVERFGALTRLGRFDEALAERAALAEMDPLADPGRTGLPADVLDAPVRLAHELRERGRDAEARAALARGVEHLDAAFRRARGREAVDLADAVSRVRAEQGDAAGALATLRLALPGLRPDERALWAQVAAGRALDAGAPESTFAYAAWAWRASDARRVAGQAMLSAARAWEALGRADSSVACDEAILARWSDPGLLGPIVRFHRATVLQASGDWELAHAEYHTLAARYPSDPLAFRGATRIVQYHLGRGEFELARIAGEAAIANLEHLLAVNRDPVVQREAGRARADLLLSIGRLDAAESALLGLWSRFPADSAVQEGALRAAELARHRAGGAPRADSILALLRRGAISATVRREAAAAADASAPAPSRR